MKIFIYKALIVVFLPFLLFEFTLGQKIKKIDNKIKKVRVKKYSTGIFDENQEMFWLFFDFRKNMFVNKNQ